MDITREQVVEYLAALDDDEAVFDVVQEAIDRIYEGRPAPEPEVVGHAAVLTEVPDEARSRVMVELRRDHPARTIMQTRTMLASMPLRVRADPLEDADQVAARYRVAGASVEVRPVLRDIPREPPPKVGFLCYPSASSLRGDRDAIDAR